MFSVSFFGGREGTEKQKAAKIVCGEKKKERE
jgi:hypothetical protein